VSRRLKVKFVRQSQAHLLAIKTSSRAKVEAKEAVDKSVKSEHKKS